MDKTEFQTKLDEINNLVEKKDYKNAIKLVDSIDWRRVKSIRTLCVVGEIYAANKRYKDSRDIFLLAHRRSPVGKTILYRLVEVCIKIGDLDEALDYYSEFLEAAPNDNTKYILKYKIYNARKANINEQIGILEEYKEKEFTERWAYELAKLYYQAGEKDKCVQLCDDIYLWFNDGKYVIKTLDLKKHLTGLTPSQEKVYDEFSIQKLEKELKEKNKFQEKNTRYEDIFSKTPNIESEEDLKNNITKGIKDIFKTSSSRHSSNQEEDMLDKQITGQISFKDIIDTSSEKESLKEEEVIPLEPEEINVDSLPKLNIPEVNLNESASIKDLPIDLNLEDTILAAAKEQGIDLSAMEKSVVSDNEPSEENKEEEIIEEEPAQKLSEEEKLMEFIDQQNADPEFDPLDIIPRESKLDEDEEKLFTYFSSVPGLKEQIIDTLKDTQDAAADKTSASGNIIIMGNKGSGKSTLAELIVKAVCRQLNIPATKYASIDAIELNKQDIPKIIDKLAGGFILIKNTNHLNKKSVAALNKAMEFRTDGLTVLLEDEKISMRKFISRNEKFTKKFTSTINIPVFTNDELVNFARVYTDDLGYKIDDMAILALYTLISENQKEDQPMTVEGVKDIIDNAISKAESGTRKLKRNLSKTRVDNEGKILLHEKDFK